MIPAASGGFPIDLIIGRLVHDNALNRAQCWGESPLFFLWVKVIPFSIIGFLNSHLLTPYLFKSKNAKIRSAFSETSFGSAKNISSRMVTFSCFWCNFRSQSGSGTFLVLIRSTLLSDSMAKVSSVLKNRFSDDKDVVKKLTKFSLFLIPNAVKI